MKEVGGYFELELNKGDEFHKNAIRLNTGRNAFEYVLLAKSYNKVFLPYYTCDAMLEPITKLKLDYEFYHIDESFRPIFDFKSIKKDDVFVFNNYFGICDIQVQEVSKNCENLIVDNSQAFFSKPLPNIDTFYSPRKFFGLPDGAYLYTNMFLEKELERDLSSSRFSHLLGRIEFGAEKYYQEYKKIENSLSSEPIQTMSFISERILKSIDYSTVFERRRKNFKYIHSILSATNHIDISLKQDSGVPMVYPFLNEIGGKLKEHLINHHIYVATYWPNINERLNNKNTCEANFQKNLLGLPIDQRYSINEIKRMLNILKQML